jgi:predicted nucleic acid-binding protein
LSLKPGVVDANVLVYSLNTWAPQHGASRALLDSARNGTVALYVSSQILCEFYSIVTNPRRVLHPLSPQDALTAVSELIGFLRILPISVPAVESRLDLLRRNPVKGADIFDVQIVATMKANGVLIIYTFNSSDFQVFPELNVLEP